MRFARKQGRFIVPLFSVILSIVALLIGQAEPRFMTQTFSVFEVFWDSPHAGIMDAPATSKHHSQVEEAQKAGLTPIATSTAWVFPPFAGAPQVPLTKVILFTDVPEARINCVPPRETAEYQRLVGIRNALWGTLAREFPELDLWVVGYEPNFLFYDCDGRELEFQSLLAFFADTLEGANKAIKSQNPDAIVVAHFLGRSTSPIFVRGQLIQPREIIDGVLLEIARRKDVQSEYFDEWAFTLDPELTLDRYPQASVPLSLGSANLTSGWNTKYLEEFTTNTSDLEFTYADWADPRTPITTTIVATTVSNGLAHVSISGTWPVIGGAVTEQNGPDVVPDQEFQTQYPERNKWTAVMDFFPVTSTYEAGAHAAVFLRVLDRTWQTVPDQTRFGAFAYRGPMTLGQDCENEPCGALQFSGDDVTASPAQSAGKQTLFNFPLTELPWNYSSHLYRVQIHERQVFHPLNFQYELRWQAEVWDLTDSNLVGQSTEIWEWSLPNILGIAVPSIDSSKLFFGLGPGSSGGIDVERTGTAWWGY